MGYEIIDAMNQRISAVSVKNSPDALTRDIGGYNRDNQPYISGYFQVMFHLPGKLFTGSSAAAVNWLHSTCEGFTPPTQTLDKIDVQGQGKVGASFVASTTITREFTLTFREYQNLPILNTIRSWSAMFDPHIGVSPLSGADFVPTSYKGMCYVIQTKPTMGKNPTDQGSIENDDIEEIWALDGVFPTTVPFDTLNSDIMTSDSVQHSVTFSFDGFPLTKVDGGDDLLKTVKSLLSGKDYMKTFDQKFNSLTSLK